MTKLPFSRVLLVATLASSFVVTGCDIRSDADEAPSSNAAAPILTPPAGAFTAGTYPLFDVALAQLPTVTDLPFLAAAGTLGDNFDGTALVANAADPAKIALNDLDGWSTNAYFDIKFSGTVDAASVFGPGNPGQNVFLVKLNTGSGDPLDPASIVAASPVAPNGEQPSYTVSVEDLDSGTDNVIRITPTAPLDPASKYLVFMTNGITASATPTTESSSYHALTAAAGAGVNAQLQGIATWLDATESIAGYIISVATGGAVSPTAARDLVTVSYTFTTSDPQKPLIAMAAPRAALVAGGATSAQAAGLEGLNLLSTPKPRPLGVSAATATDLNALSLGALTADIADLYTGYITLPYYQTAPASSADFSYLATSMWRADLTLAGALGKSVPQDYSQTVAGPTTTTVVDGTTNVTWRYPFATETGGFNGNTTETIPLQVTLPDKTYNSPTLGDTCGNVQASEGGYPVAIYVHGITSDRTSVIALAHGLAQLCIATVAIDLPMHGIDSNSSYAGSLNVNHGSISAAISALYGATVATNLRERHFDQTLDGTTPAQMNFSTPNAYDDSGKLFINLSNLQNTRDNLREGVQDLLNLNASLGNIGALDLDADGNDDFNLSKVYVVGVSLGGMVGTTFAAVNEAARLQESAAGFTSNLNAIKGVVVSAGGTQLTQILMNSPTFGPTISAGLTLAGAGVGTSNRESFLNIAQATVDSADPVNFAGLLDTLNVPTLVQMIVGGGDTTGLGDATVWGTDNVVPNSVATAPLAGTDPLATLLGAGPTTDGTSNDATAGNLLSELTIGYHTSLLIPNAAAPTGPWTTGEELATGELQAQAATFILSGGAAFSVGSAGGGLAAGFTTP